MNEGFRPFLRSEEAKKDNHRQKVIEMIYVRARNKKMLKMMRHVHMQVDTSWQYYFRSCISTIWHVVFPSFLASLLRQKERSVMNSRPANMSSTRRDRTPLCNSSDGTQLPNFSNLLNVNKSAGTWSEFMSDFAPFAYAKPLCKRLFSHYSRFHRWDGNARTRTLSYYILFIPQA